MPFPPNRDWFIKHGHKDSVFFLSINKGIFDAKLIDICQELQGRVPKQEELNELWYDSLFYEPNETGQSSWTAMRKRAQEMWSPHLIGGIKGSLRVVHGQGYFDDRGPYLPLGCHHLHGLWLHRNNRTKSLEQLDAIKNAGYDIVRTSFSLGWYDSFWGDRGVYPISFDDKHGNRRNTWSDYNNVTKDYFSELQKRNLRLDMTFGDGQMFGNLFNLHRFMERIGNLAKTFPNLIALIEWNEAWQNWVTNSEPFPSEVQNALDICLREYGQNTIRSISDRSEEVSDLNKWRWDICNKHGFRGGDDDDKIRHARNINYDGHGVPPIIYEGWETEPPGPGKNVSVGTMSNPEALVNLALANLMTGYGFNYMSSDGVKWDKPIEKNPGFFEVARCRSLLPPDIMKYRRLLHGGRPESLLTTDDFNKIKRIDSGEKDNEVWGQMYSDKPVTNGKVIANKRCKLKIWNVVTHKLIREGILEARQSTDISFERGVLFQGIRL